MQDRLPDQGTETENGSKNRPENGQKKDLRNRPENGSCRRPKTRKETETGRGAPRLFPNPFDEAESNAAYRQRRLK